LLSSCIRRILRPLVLGTLFLESSLGTFSPKERQTVSLHKYTTRFVTRLKVRDREKEKDQRESKEATHSRIISHKSRERERERDDDGRVRFVPI
jgi:hypothetical protein